jgi:8-amino-7-oxononanoate synthase
VPYNWVDHDLLVLEKANWLRTVRQIPPEFVNFGSNDYLGLAEDDRLKNASIDAIKKYGTGTTGSRLLSGHRDLHEELENKIARLKQTEDALVFSSGYLANLGTIPALVGKRDLILADQYNHSCLVNGCRLSGATIKEFRHLDWQDLEFILQEYRSGFQRCLIVTNSVFSMTGDVAPLKEIVALSDRFGAMVMVDEAHGTGVFGKNGSGLVEMAGIDQPIVQVGTLSKAIGSLGGFVAGSAKLINYLRSRVSTWIYTTALSPADTAAAIKGIELISSAPELREKLWQNIRHLANLQKQSELGLSPIFSIGMPDIPSTLALAEKFWQNSIYAPAIRPPTVPTPKIRISLTAKHSLDQIDRVWEIIKTIRSDSTGVG